MSNGVEFEEDSFRLNKPNTFAAGGNSAGSYSAPSNFGQYSNTSDRKGMAGWLMRKGVTKSSGTAQGLLIAVIIFNLVVAYLVIHFLA